MKPPSWAAARRPLMKQSAIPVHTLTLTALMAAMLCVLGPLSIPIGPVPLSLATLVIYLSVYLLGWKWGLVSVVVYLLVGMSGVPVFSGFGGGIGRLLGPTGGYLIGYLPLAALSGLGVQHSSRRCLHLLAMAVGTVALYALGTAWYCFEAGTTLGAAMAKCVWIFIPGDLIKMAIAIFVGPVLHERLTQANILK